MDQEQQRLRMRHNQPGFWQFAAAYILIGGGTLLILLEILNWVLGWQQMSLTPALISIGVGIFALSGLTRKYKSASPIQGIRESDQSKP